MTMIYKGVDLNLPASVKKLISRIEKVGSTVTCHPPPTDTDIDYLVYVENDCLDALLDDVKTEKEIDIINILRNDGWELAGSLMYEYTNQTAEGHTFYSLRKDKYNIILTPEYEMFRKFLAATSVAKKFNLLDKRDRVILFQAVLYGNPCEYD